MQSEQHVIYKLMAGGVGAARPKLTRKKLTENNCREWKLTTVDPQERSTRRSGVRSAILAACRPTGENVDYILILPTQTT